MDAPWKVTRQSQTTALDPDTQEYATMVEVRFITAHGDTGSVFIRPEAFTAEAAEAKINARVAVLNKLRGVTSGE